MEVKEFATFHEQLEKLKERGCIVADENFAIRQLKRINYYRFTAYFLPFKTEDGKYIDGTSFDTVFRIYEFDRKLRGLILSACEQIELMLRANIAYYHSQKYGPLGYTDECNFKSMHDHQKLMDTYNKEIEKNFKQKFVQHHIEKYDSMFPLWVVVELFSMGCLSRFYADMKVEDKKIIAKRLFNSSYCNVTSWLYCLTTLRNFCAHYSRLYYNKFGKVPATPKELDYTLDDDVFSYIMILKLLYPDPIEWRKIWLTSLFALIEEYQGVINMKHIGFPDNWEELLEQ